MTREELHKLNVILFDNLDTETYSKIMEYLTKIVQENKQLKERIYKAIKMFESDEHFEDGCYCEEIEKKILKGDSNE